MSTDTATLPDDLQDLVGRTVRFTQKGRTYRLHVTRVDDEVGGTPMVFGYRPSRQHPGDYVGRSWTYADAITAVEDDGRPEVTESTPLHVLVTVAVDVDPDAWATEYGLQGATRSAIRADVKAHAASTITSHLSSLGLLAE